jgi:hypothetical protein
MRRPRSGWFSLLAILVAGSVASAPSAARPGAAAGAAQTCDARVDQLEKWLASSSWQPPVLLDEADVPALPRELERVGRDAPRGPQLRVTPGSIVLDGTAVWSAGQPLAPVGKRLGDMLLVTKKLYERPFESVLVAAARDARWEQMVATADGLQRAGLAADLAFEVPRAMPAAPPPSPLGREMAKAGSDPVALSRFNKKVFSPCPDAVRIFAQLQGQPDKVAFMVRGIPAALRRCSCATTPEDARTWFWYLVVAGGQPGIRVIRVVPGDVKARPVRAARTDTWNDTLQRVIGAADGGKGNRPIRLEQR